MQQPSTANIRKVNFTNDRHVRRGKRLIGDMCDVVESLDGQVAGYFVTVWNDSGLSATAWHSGGPVSPGVLTTFIAEKAKKISD